MVRSQQNCSEVFFISFVDDVVVVYVVVILLIVVAAYKFYLIFVKNVLLLKCFNVIAVIEIHIVVVYLLFLLLFLFILLSVIDYLGSPGDCC